MTPVAKTGLHCGDATDTEVFWFADDVTPVAKTGLHCGAVKRQMIAVSPTK